MAISGQKDLKKSREYNTVFQLLTPMILLYGKPLGTVKQMLARY